MTSHEVSDDQLPRGAGDAPDVAPVPAASVILLRDAPNVPPATVAPVTVAPAARRLDRRRPGGDSNSRLEVLMMRRHAKSSFVPDAWVFPGGTVEASDRELGDGTEISTMCVAAIRELFEESGIWLGAPLADADRKRRALLAGELTFASLAREASLDLDALVLTSRWVTPIGVPKRFDTCFFLAIAGSDAIASVDNGEDGEAVEVRWITPAAAIETLPIVFPTLKNLEALAGFETAKQLLDSRRGIDIPTTRPVLVFENGKKKIILP
ncbi:MAG TPA: NUDIX hydrolase [Thermoanaerobaculia bacterium]|nr:NUDIX hydrolase [Thermoanaerobaculia bacterium]